MLDRIFAGPNFEDANDLRSIFSTDNEGYLFKQQDLTIQKIVAYLDEINKSADRQTDLSDAEEESTIVSYPNFINWDELKSLTKGNIDRLTTKQHNSIIEKVKEYDEYRKYFYSDHFKTKLDELIYKYESIEKPEEIIITTIPEKKKVSWWRRIFNFIFGITPKEDPIKEYANQPSGEDLTNSNTASDIDECWYFLKRMQELRNNYTQYINKYEELALKQSSIQDSIDKFELFNHNRSRCAIDDSKIYNYYKNQFENLKDKLENHDEEQDILDVFKDAYKVVNQRKDIWGKFDLNDPHDFIVIKEDNLHDIIKEIHAKSTPFTNILIDESSDYSDKIHRMIYSDNDLTDWFEKNKSQVNYSHFITVKRSSSVVNKICMFQFFTLDNYLQCLGDLRE